MTKRISRLLVLVCGLAAGCSGTGRGPGVGANAPPPLSESEWRAAPLTPKGPLGIHTDPGELPRLELASDPTKQLTLEHTHVSAKLTGFVAEVEVSQTYANPFSEPIEAVYVFPLPENSAVNHMRMVIDRRVIEASVKERVHARQIYTEAKQQGHTAALLEQERPNVFTQSVANIEPGKKIDVVVRYMQDLSYDAGEYEFVFPMVVGPRFMPGEPLAKAPSGSGTQPDTTRVPDASRISPPYVGRGRRSGRQISLELVADPKLAVTSFEVPTHEVVARRPADGTLRLTLAEKDSIPNRDFVLRYRVAEARPKATLYLSDGGAGAPPQGGFFSLVVAPPATDVESLVGRREIVFVVDVSGSMSGMPLAMCKSAIRDALHRLRPVDTFNIFTFSGNTRKAFEHSVPANAANVHTAILLVNDFSAQGGTHMADAVAAALTPDGDGDRHRYVFFMTDGYVGNEGEIIARAHRFVSDFGKNGRRARVFGFGVGSSVNRYLIDGLSEAGQGLAVYATTREDPGIGVNEFFHYIDRAVLEDLRIDWGKMQAEELFPNPIPDLFASHPLILHGRYKGKPSAQIAVHARAQGRSLAIPIAVQEAPPELSGPRVLGALWAREKIAFLDDQFELGTDTQDQITKLGLDFHLVTRFTSLVAVDDSRRAGDGKPRRIVQPQEEPEGVDVAMAGGESQGYGYSYDDDPLNAEHYADIVPAEPSTRDMKKEAARPTNQSVYTVDQSSPRRGCGCAVPQRGAGQSSLWLAALALGAVGLRRTRRSRRRAALE